jgi:hypothetical protein
VHALPFNGVSIEPALDFSMKGVVCAVDAGYVKAGEMN